MSFLKKIFGGKSSSTTDTSNPQVIVEDILENIISISNLDLSYDVQIDGTRIFVEVFGEDEELLQTKDGQLLDAFQLFIKRVLQHKVTEANYAVSVDNDGYREKANQSLIDLAEKLKGVVVEKGKPVYFRALPPRDRKVIHQYLAEDERVKSRSVGDGLYKKIKIYPTNGKSNPGNSTETANT